MSTGTKLRVVGVALASFGIGATGFVGWHLMRPVKVAASTVVPASAVSASDAETPLVALDEPVAPLGEGKVTAVAVTTTASGARPPTTPVATSNSTWDGRDTLRCAGPSEMSVVGVTAKLPGVVVDAAGSCKLHLVRVHLEGDRVLDIAGAAQVTIEDSTLVGTRYALYAGARTVVVVRRTTMTGDTGVDLGGTTTTTLVDSAVIGRTHALDVGGGAHLTLVRTQTTGPVSLSGQAIITR